MAIAKGDSVRVRHYIPEYGLRAGELVTVVVPPKEGQGNDIEDCGVSIKFVGRTRTDAEDEMYTWGMRLGWLAPSEFEEVPQMEDGLS